jgi:hypothetical protein
MIFFSADGIIAAIAAATVVCFLFVLDADACVGLGDAEVGGGGDDATTGAAVVTAADALASDGVDGVVASSAAAVACSIVAPGDVEASATVVLALVLFGVSEVDIFFALCLPFGSPVN